ncbi:MAG TPA: glycosyltransferase [Neobacillus sp.]
MKKILIASFDMEVGGVERSLISMLDHFDYKNFDVDVMLYRHQGDFMSLLSKRVNLLNEIPHYSTFRKSIGEIITEKHYLIGCSRILAKINAEITRRLKNIEEPGYYQMQIIWKYTLPFLPKLKNEYDLAISYLWPHYFVADKVMAKKKIAWIHTDYSMIETDIAQDIKMWNKFDHIVAVSEACKASFLAKYPELEGKVMVIENIVSPEFIKEMSTEKVETSLEKDTRFKLLTVARLSHAKGIDHAVKALKLVKDRGYKNIAWYIVGFGGDEALIRELIKKNQLEASFILLGKKTNPYPYMKECDVYVQPSRYEGKAVTVNEAKILGKPILITNYPTSESQIQHGIDGYISELSIEGLANGIEKLYLDAELRLKLAENCRNTDYGNKSELEKLFNLVI